MKGSLDQLTIDELSKVAKDAKEEIRAERFKSVTGKLDDTKKTRELKKKIARANTLKREYELGIRKKA
jgi:large subunit ribosomal protein L29